MGKNKTVKHDRSPDVAPNILIALVHDAGQPAEHVQRRGSDPDGCCKLKWLIC